jgi:steroid delta-isomerase-like uncharacterized protein
MAGTNAEKARRWFKEVWNQRRADTVREMIDPDGVCHSEGGELRGVQAFLDQVHGPFLTALPDLRLTVEGTVAEGDQVVVRWTAAGTHTGPGLGMPPSGRKVRFRGMTWMRFSDGKLVEGQDSWNLAGLLQALSGGPPAGSVAVE